MECSSSLPEYSWKNIVRTLTILIIGCLVTADAVTEQHSTTIDTLETVASQYVTESDGEVKWTFPQSVLSQVQRLQETHRIAWKKLYDELGKGFSSNMEIRIAINPEHMQALAPRNSHLPSYATGVAFPKLGVILLTLTAPKTWRLTDIETVLVHELSHLALYRAVDSRSLPRWFSEGIAVYEAEEQTLSRIRMLWEGSLRSQIIPLDQLSDAFPHRDHQVNLAYAQSADFIGFLLKGEDNQKRFHQLITSLKQGKEFEDAIYKSYYVPLGYLEHEWRRSLKSRFGRWPLLLTTMGTIWVLACILLVFAYYRIRRKQKEMLRRWELEEASITRSKYLKDNLSRPNKSSLPMIKDVQSHPNSHEVVSIPTIEYEGRNHTLH